MRDTVSPMVQFSPYGGELRLETVPGSAPQQPNPENEIEARAGRDRTMYAYVPASGCPHEKQTAVLMVLRDDAERASAERLLHTLRLDALAEDRHLVVLFPDPEPGGWNHAGDPAREDDTAFLVRCFAALPASRGGVAGFNGLMFYLACSPRASALVMSLAAASPVDAAGVMVGRLPEGCEPKGEAPQVAWLCEPDEALEAHLARVNRTGAPLRSAYGSRHVSPVNPAVQHVVRRTGLTAEEVTRAWEELFSTTRRWRNHTHGTYRPRIDFSQRGFVARVRDTTLAPRNASTHTWFTYAPPRVLASQAPVPLVIYLHGGNCCGLYGAEQSGWADLADRDGMVVVFPDAPCEERWNVWDDPRLPSDAAFVLALIDRMRATYPVDPTRVYLSGFSMGSMFASALACSYPQVFAGVVALNGPHLGYLRTLDESRAMMRALRRTSIIDELPQSERATSVTRDRADAAASARPLRMPFVQCVGLLGPVGFGAGRTWPARDGDEDGDLWTPTVRYWKQVNGLPAEPLHDAAAENGFAADVTTTTGDDRIVHQSWASADGTDAPFHLLSVRRLAHAVEPSAVDLGWQIVRRYARDADGRLRVCADIPGTTAGGTSGTGDAVAACHDD
ncbi:MAG: hypothetical protein IPK37_10950 [Austwickia sp.]|nr:MAG: hypothetical protein IPK37_10950 [Austwickia sp.]